VANDTSAIVRPDQSNCEQHDGRSQFNFRYWIALHSIAAAITNWQKWMCAPSFGPDQAAWLDIADSVETRTPIPVMPHQNAVSKLGQSEDR
jgi:hypothetical protein